MRKEKILKILSNQEKGRYYTILINVDYNIDYTCWITASVENLFKKLHRDVSCDMWTHKKLNAYF